MSKVEKKVYTVDELAAMIPDFGGVEVVVEARQGEDYYGEKGTPEVRVRGDNEVDLGWGKPYDYNLRTGSVSCTVVPSMDEGVSMRGRGHAHLLSCGGVAGTARVVSCVGAQHGFSCCLSR